MTVEACSRREVGIRFEEGKTVAEPHGRIRLAPEALTEGLDMPAGGSDVKTCM